MELNRRGFVAYVLGAIGLTTLGPQFVNAAANKEWILDDLQYGADYLDQHYNMCVNRIVCSHSDRRRFIKLTDDMRHSCQFSQQLDVIKCGEVEIKAERGMPEGKFFMLDTTKMHPLLEYDAVNRAFL